MKEGESVSQIRKRGGRLRGTVPSPIDRLSVCLDWIYQYIRRLPVDWPFGQLIGLPPLLAMRANAAARDLRGKVKSGSEYKITAGKDRYALDRYETLVKSRCVGRLPSTSSVRPTQKSAKRVSIRVACRCIYLTVHLSCAHPECKFYLAANKHFS